MPGKILFSRVLQNRASNPSTDNSQEKQPSLRPQGRAHVMGEYRDDYAPRASQYGQRDYPRYDNRGDRADRGGDRGNDRGEGNKIRRGPGRRLAKEKQRVRSNMDPALLQKYNSLSPALQEKINATIEICYQQHMASVYRNAEQGVAQDVVDEDDHYDMDVEVDADPSST